MAMPASQTIVFGALTRAGHGGHALGYTGSGTLTVTGGTNAAHWTINDSNQIVPQGTYGTAPTSTLSGPYTLTVSDGALTSTVTINLLTDTFSAAARLTGSNTGGVNGATDVGDAQFKATLALAAYGQTVQLRDGTVVGDDTAQLTIRRTSTPTGFTGENHIVVKPDTALGATLTSIKLDGQKLKRCDGIRFQSVMFRSTQAGIAMLTATANVDYLDVWDCDFSSNDASLYGTDTADAIVGPGTTVGSTSGLVVNSWRIRRNNIHGCGKGIYLSNVPFLVDAAGKRIATGQSDTAGTATHGPPHEVSFNRLSNIAYDSINITNGVGTLLNDNFITDKKTACFPHPSTVPTPAQTSIYQPYYTGSGGQPHGDGVQFDYSGMVFGSYEAPKCYRNVWTRGNGRDTMPWFTSPPYANPATAPTGVSYAPDPTLPFPDSQGIFLANADTSKPARGATLMPDGVHYNSDGYPTIGQHLEIVNNAYFATYGRGISFEFQQDPICEYNTVLADKGVPNLPNVSSAGGIYASSIQGTAGRVRRNIAHVVTITYASGGALNTDDNPLVSYVDDYTPVFAAPAYGGAVNTPATFKAAYKPKTTGGAAVGAGLFAGQMFPDGTMNDGSVFGGAAGDAIYSQGLLCRLRTKL